MEIYGCAKYVDFPFYLIWKLSNMAIFFDDVVIKPSHDYLFLN